MYYLWFKVSGNHRQRTDQENAEGSETKEEHAEKNPSIKTEKAKPPGSIYLSLFLLSSVSDVLWWAHIT